MARLVSIPRKSFNTTLAGFLGFLMFFPVLWIVILSFKTEGDAIKAPLEILFATGWTVESYGGGTSEIRLFQTFHQLCVHRVRFNLSGTAHRCSGGLGHGFCTNEAD